MKPFRLLFLYLVAISCFLVSGSIFSEESTAEIELNFPANEPGSFPYLYFDENTQKYQGVIRSLFDYIEENYGITVNYVDSNQLRSEAFIRDGKFDLYLISPAWLNKPETFIYSMPIVKHWSYLYSTTPFLPNFNVSDITNARVCTRDNYVYNGIEAYFQNGSLVRVNASNQRLMASMLVAKRCDYAVMNNFNAWRIFSELDECVSNIYQSPVATSTTELVIAMRPALQSIAQKINEAIVKFIQTGLLHKAIQVYFPEVSFPISLPSRCAIPIAS